MPNEILSLAEEAIQLRVKCWCALAILIFPPVRESQQPLKLSCPTELLLNSLPLLEYF